MLLRVSAQPKYVFALSVSTHSNYVSFGRGQHPYSLVVVCVVVVVVVLLLLVVVVVAVVVVVVDVDFVVLPCPVKFSHL